jgi:eukaryotic-like serine/threonine-protein kinase
MPHVTPLEADDPHRVGQYRLAGQIEGTPEGTVYLARTRDGGDVTVTLLGSDWTRNGAARDRFIAEARAARRVPPFCAARILDAGLEGSEAFLVREYVAGPSLLELVYDAGPRRGAELEAVAVGAATGLASVHQAGLVHGAFGPEHLVLGPSGPRVVEFGITPPYGPATPSADILAWARTVLFAATGGRHPTHGDLRQLPEPLRSLVSASLSRNPAERPQARQIVRDLLGGGDLPAGVLGEGARRAEPAGRPAAGGDLADLQRPRAARRMRRLVWAAGAAACVLAIAVAVHVLQGQNTKANTAGQSPGAATQAARPPATRPDTASASGHPAPSASPTIPAGVAGSWSGTVTQTSPVDTFSVTLGLDAGASSGTVAYSGDSFSCSGDLSVSSTAGFTVTMNQTIVKGVKTCANGVVTVKPGPTSGSLSFSFSGPTGPMATGMLAKA